jgi:phosphatidylglycerophosphate synthase
MTISDSSLKRSADSRANANLSQLEHANTTAPLSGANKPLAYQKGQESISVYFARKVSRHVTPAFLWLRISANQVTALWGLVSLATSYVIYLTIVGHYLLLPAIPALYFVVVVLDCVDGEIARFRHTASPIGGKLLDGVWHKATEYSLLAVYVAAAYYWTHSRFLFPIGLALMAGEAMYTYVYERRLLVIRLYAKSSEYIDSATADDLYGKDEDWRDFSVRKKFNAFKGLIQYKSVYFMIALSWFSASVLFAGIILLTAYKHYAWLKLLVRTVIRPPQVAKE